MELLSTFLIIAIIIYIIYEFFLVEDNDDDDGSVSRRLHEYSPKYDGKKKEEDEDSAVFIRQAINLLSQKIISKSQNVLNEKQLLVEAGMASDDDSYMKHMSKKLIHAGVFAGIGLFIVLTGTMEPLMKMLIIAAFPLFGFRYPDMKIKGVVKHRTTEVTYALPDAIDLLSVCVEAGLGLDAAIVRVATEMEKTAPIIAFEFKRVGKDILAGIPKSDAFRALAKRNGSIELKSFVALLIQTDKLGTSISQTLKIYAETMRTKRKQKAEKLAAEASIKMSIPLVLFILPATFIVILAPAALSIMKTFSGGGP